MTTDALAGTWNQIMTDAQRRWTKLTEYDLVEARGNVQKMIALVQERYGYTRERAEHDVTQFLDQYDSRVYDVARRLPGDLPSKVMRRPWATIATALGVGISLGLAMKPGCREMKRIEVAEDENAQSWTA